MTISANTSISNSNESDNVNNGKSQDELFSQLNLSINSEKYSVSDDDKSMMLSPTSSTISNSYVSLISSYADPNYSNLDDDQFGWFETTVDLEESSSEEVRNAWMKVVEHIAHVETTKPELPVEVLYSWNNPHPSLSLKLSSSDIVKVNGFGINISSCVSGFRICQYSSGEIRAEFHFIFCYGSRSYSSWKPYNEFKKLADIIKCLHNKVKPIFEHSLKEWQWLEEKKRWFRCLKVKYLIEKSIYLGRFMEALLLESPSPGLILAFVQHSKLNFLPSW